MIPFGTPFYRCIIDSLFSTYCGSQMLGGIELCTSHDRMSTHLGIRFFSNVRPYNVVN